MQTCQRRRSCDRNGLSRNLLLAGVGGLVLTSFSVLGLLFYVNSAPDESQKLEVALRLMRKGDGETSAGIARSINPKSLKKRTDLSKREFILGSNERRVAEKIAQRRIATERNERAVKYLEKSRDLRFPDGYEGQGNYYLGMALFDLYRWDDAQTPLQIAAERWPQGRADSLEHLVDIDLSFEKMDTESALARIENWRALPRTSPNEEERANVKEMQVLYAAKDYEGAIKLAKTIPSESPLRSEADLVYGRCIQQLSTNSPDRPQMLQEAAESFMKVIGAPRASLQTRGQSNLELGRVQRDLGNLTQAVSTFSILRLSSPYEPESLVGGLEEIDTLIDLKRSKDAVDTLEHLTKNFGELKWYQNEWMPLSLMRKKIVKSGERMVDSRAFEDAAQFAKLLPPMCDRMDRLRLQSRLYEMWAIESSQRREDDSQTISRHRISAEAFEALARMSMRSPEYIDLLNRAIENYRLAGAFQESNKLLDLYLQYEPRENQPVGWLTKARNYKSMDKPDMAMAALLQVMDSRTNTSVIYDARLEAARIFAAKDDFEQAEELIVKNLYYSDLKPESPVWRESLFELGTLLFRRGEMLQSQAKKAIADTPSKSIENYVVIEQSYNELIRGIARIEECLQRFENDPRRIEMLYTTAKAYQLAAWWPELLLRENRIANEDTIANWKAQRRELLKQSRSTFSKLRHEITAVSEIPTPGSNIENYLRNGYFGEADLLYEAGEYTEALNAYREAANRFINEPESLEAMTQIANCQKQMGQKLEARRTLETAKEALDRINATDTRFKSVTSHDRNGWIGYIDWMIKEVENLPN